MGGATSTPWPVTLQGPITGWRWEARTPVSVSCEEAEVVSILIPLAEMCTHHSGTGEGRKREPHPRRARLTLLQAGWGGTDCTDCEASPPHPSLRGLDSLHLSCWPARVGAEGWLEVEFLRTT